MTDAEILALYPADYHAARQQFLSAAHAADAAVLTEVLPGLSGPGDEELALDAAYFGAPDAANVLVMLAGTHGSEAYAASPLLAAFLQQSCQGASLPPDVGVLLVHAVNPYGFAHMLRTNEHNVDLNRNFIDFSMPLPENPDYLQIHAMLCPEDRSASGRTAAQAELDAWVAAHGQARFFSAVFNGQYETPGGLMYGGQERQWSNRALERVARRFLGHAKRIAFIDWHTGLGEYGKPFFLCFNEPGSQEWENCCSWWGRDAVDTRAGFNGAPRPQYSGLVFYGMRDFCAEAEFSGAVIEFGTTPPEESIVGLQVDNRLRFDSGLGSTERVALYERALESFCPKDAQWRIDVMRMGLKISSQALNGLCARAAN